jgi:hypothetical protein
MLYDFVIFRWPKSPSLQIPFLCFRCSERLMLFFRELVRPTFQNACATLEGDVSEKIVAKAAAEPHPQMNTVKIFKLGC